MAVIRRRVLTLSTPILLPADAKRMEHVVHSTDVHTAAISPIKDGSIFSTHLDIVYSTLPLTKI
jgi:hypothetical protein